MIGTYGFGTVAALVRRDLTLFVRQRSRLVGALAQPLILWLIIGAGIAPAFRLSGDDSVGYMEYFFPGIVVMLLLQNGISATMSVIEDRHRGFLQGVLVAPGSRVSLVLGKCFGASVVSLVQTALFLSIAPLAGFPYTSIDWLAVVVFASLTAVAFNALGFTFAWWLDSTAGYHVVMSLVLFPLWMMSGAMFPAEGLHPVLGWIVRLNPMSYAVSGLRRALHGGLLPDGTAVPWSATLVDGLVLAVAGVSLVVVAGAVCRRRPAAG